VNDALGESSRVVRLTEYGSSEDIRCTEAAAAALTASGLVEARPTTYAGMWSLVPGGKVGAVRVGDLRIHVAPKLTIVRVLFLLEYAPARPIWQSQMVGVDDAEDLLSAVAAVFARAADTATRAGLVQGYRTIEEALPVLRGRLREADQMRLWQGRPLPAEVRYDDFTVDIPENQLLLAATNRLLRMRLLTSPSRQTLLVVRQRLAEVTSLVAGSKPPRWTPSRLNVRYQPALRLAELVLGGSSFEHRVGALAVSGFVLDMPKVFEDFVTAALTEALGAFGGRVQPQQPTWLDEDEDIRMYPDIVWVNDAQRSLAVVDAKYKAEKHGSFPDADLYQAHAYATALDLQAAHLAYAKGNESARRYVVRHSGIRISAHVLDLGLQPRALLAQVGRLANTLALEAATPLKVQLS
jgi:5-methylcytosine-specific restriction enzyme subunit McrC